jgi:putative nucleotidyltransferase with HDIG domain
VVDKKDGYTLAHAEHTAALACALATTLGLSSKTVRSLRLAGLLHDVGMVAVPETVLMKTGALDAVDWMILRQHVALSVTLVQAALADPDLQMAIAHHHERWDGAGYPGGVAGPAIPLVGRILTIADAATSMLQDRPYRKALDRAAIIGELRRGAGTQFDPDLVEPLIGVFGVVHPGR